MQNVSQSHTVDVYLTTLLNPRRLHKTACRTLSLSSSAEQNNIVINISKKVFLLRKKRLSLIFVSFFTSKQIQGESILWLRRLLLYVLLNAVLQSFYGLLNNH